MNLLHLLQDRLRSALAGWVDDPAPYLEMVKPAKDAKFGDYQANCAMPLAKVRGQKPRDVAAELVIRLNLGEVVDTPEIAGPGFINLRFKKEFLAQALQQLAGDDRLGVPAASPARTFVIDYSSPNVAKPMHVGHLRSTIIGDALKRLLRFLGHTVLGDNHLGDWGTQFGMLIYGWKHFLYPAALETDPVREMVRLYVRVRNEIGAAGDDAAEVAVNPVAEACRQETAKLHAGDPENVALWQKMMPWCQAELDKVYQRLDVQFDHTHGESFYNPMLPGVVEELLAKGIAEVSNGAVVVFHSRETDDRGNLKEPPSLIRKRDGAFTYTTSDLATIRYRMDHYHPDAALYVVDFRQALHFKQLFAIARKWGYANVELQHIQFGSVLGPDGKPIKTREGGAIELEQLLDEAIQRARKIVDQESPELTEAERAAVAEAVGIGAVKYADLSQNRTSDYVFSWDKMLAMNGNTGTYMQYAYARCCNIFRKGNERREAVRAEPPLPSLDTAAERGLGLMLLRFPEAVAEAAAAYHPHAITGYLWDLATALSAFYRDCQVLKAETAALRRSRLLLCDLTARVIQKGLHLLGIRTMERM